MNTKLLLLFAATISYAQVPQAFIPVPSGGLRRPTEEGKRARAVTIAPGLFERDSAKPEKLIDLNLFDDLMLRVKFEKMEYAGPGDKTVIWTGTVLNTKRGSVVMAVTGKIHSATITTDTASFALQHASEAAHWISERDPNRLAPDGEPVRVPSGELPLRRTPTTLADDGSIVDVMVVYTAAARAAAGGTTQMNNLIALGIAETNQGYANSNITQRVRLAHAAEVTYTESGSFSTDLGRLRSSTDGYIDNIHTLRDTYRADIVSLWVNSGDYCGLAYLLTDTTTDFSSRAFNVVRRDCATGYYSFAHEMGHNMGATHDQANSGGPGLFPYSYGYQQKTVQPFFRTVMAYACSGGVNCERINYWSNPDVTYSGLVTGNATANNRLTLNNSRTTSANWRQASAPVTISPSSATFGSAASTGSITVTASVAWSATSNANWITITSGASGSGNGTVNYSVLANPTTSSRVGSITVGGLAFTITQSGSSVTCTSTAITIPTTFSSSLVAGDCASPLRSGSRAKRYTFNAAAGQQIAITMTSAAIDSYLYLLGPNGSVLTENDDGGGGLNSRIPANSGFYTLPTTGIYTIEASSFNDNETGAFTITISAPANCTYSISPTSRTVDANINTGSVSITTTSGCSWIASSNTAWISVSSQGSGTGNGTTNYSVQANASTASRTGTITVAGQTFTLTQSGLSSACTVSPITSGVPINGSLTTTSCSSQSRGANYYAGRYSFTGSIGQQISILLTSATLDTYLYLIGPNGNVVASDDDSAGNLNSRIPATGSFTLQQSGTFIIEATTFDSFDTGSFTLALSAGCGYTISPLNASYGSNAATGSISVTATAGCGWSAITSSGFVNVTSGFSGSGSGTVNYNVAANVSGAARTGTLTIAGINVTITQSGVSAGCPTTPLAIPQTVNGTLSSSACYSIGRGSGYYADRYAFSGSTGQQISITLDSSTYDTYLYLLGPNGAVVTSDDDGGPGTNSRIPANSGFYTLPSSGVYTIESTTYTSTRTGAYTLAIQGTGTPNPGSGPFRFVAVTPCRVADTRAGSGFSGNFGAPFLAAGTSRSIPVTASPCGIPTTARAFSLNITVVPRGPLAYLTTWPSDLPQPLVSTLNSPLGRIVANAAIVPASNAGAISVFVSDAADVIIDINGYFAP